MKIRKLMIGAAVLMAVIALVAVTGFTQEDIETVEDSAYETTIRPPARFLHDVHNENAGIEECNVCHHVYTDGVRDDYESSEGTECSECHLEEGQPVIDLTRKYHLQCKGCHEHKGGPLTCGQCHRKS